MMSHVQRAKAYAHEQDRDLRLDFYDKMRSAVQRILQPWGGRNADADGQPYETGGAQQWH